MKKIISPLKKALRLELLLIVLLAALMPSCKKKQAICNDALARMVEHEYVGLIRICNAEPGMATWSGTASVTSPTATSIAVHLVSDTTSLDTVLQYTVDCMVVESDIPVVTIRNGAGEEVGQFNGDPGWISFAFAYANCPDRTWFEGYEK
jgi:hypothetical protein